MKTNMVSFFQKKTRINVGSSDIYSIDLSPCGKYLACAQVAIIIKFDLKRFKLTVKGRKEHTLLISSIRYSPNGQLLASGSFDNTIIIWDAVSLHKIGMTLQGHKLCVRSISFSPDSTYLVSGSMDKTIKIWSCKSQQQIGANIEMCCCVQSVEYSPNGLQILSAGYENISIWDSTNRELLFKLYTQEHQIFFASYSSDSRYIVFSARNIIKILDGYTYQLFENNLIGHGYTIKCVLFSPDSSLIVSASDDRTIRLWDFQTQKQLYVLHTHNHVATAVTFSKDGKYILSSSKDGSICMIRIRNSDKI